METEAELLLKGSAHLHAASSSHAAVSGSSRGSAYSPGSPLALHEGEALQVWTLPTYPALNSLLACVCVRVCVCVNADMQARNNVCAYAHTHGHTHTYGTPPLEYSGF